MSKYRFVMTAANNGGTPCPELQQTQGCAPDACPIDCSVGAWEDYGACSQSCGHGSKSRHRMVMNEALFGGTACPALSQTVSCNDQACPQDCSLTVWGEWSTCTKTCGSGEQTRSRTLVARESFGGALCGALDENAVCNFGPCPIDCTVGEWEPWTGCSVTCGSGSRTTTRNSVPIN